MFKRIATYAVLSLLCALIVAQPSYAAYYYNWPRDNKSDWHIVTLSKKDVELVAQFTSSDDYGVGTKSIPNDDIDYYVQGGVVTEKHFVFSVFKNDRAQNYVYFADRSSGKIVKTIGGNWGHMNAFFYDWGTSHVRIDADDGDDGCFDDNTYAEVSASKCKSKRPDSYGVRGLTYQGRAEADGYVYHAGWDSGNGDFGQKWTYERDCNAVFIYQKGTKKLIKTLYVPKDVADGEIEDVSIDGNGDLYLFYNLTHTDKGAGFYRIKQSIVGTSVDKTNGESPNTTSDQPNVYKLDKTSEGSCASLLTWLCKGASNDIMSTIKFIIAILTAGVAVISTIGVIISALTILTARDNVAQVERAKKRLLDIVIGLVMWVTAATLLEFLLPGADVSSLSIIKMLL